MPCFNVSTAAVTITTSRENNGHIRVRTAIGLVYTILVTTRCIQKKAVSGGNNNPPGVWGYELTQKGPARVAFSISMQKNKKGGKYALRRIAKQQFM